MKHTPEPWEFAEWNTGINNSPGFGLMTDVGSLNVTVHTRKPKGNGFDEVDCTDQAIADARRIVSCVNACAGIEDPAAAIQAARDALEAARPELQATCAMAKAYGTKAMCSEAALVSVDEALKLLKPST